MEKVSIIVPVYNVELYIQECVESILQQTYENFELILVDDGSTDSSEILCREYEKKDNRVKYVYKENGGVSTARNQGIEISQGSLIVFVDSDDIIKKDMVKQLAFNIEDSDFSMCGYEIFDKKENGCLEKYCCEPLHGTIHELTKHIKEYLSPPFLLGPCFKMFKRDIIQKFHLRFPPELSYGEDAVFVFEYLKHCDKINILSDAGYMYRKHGNATLSRRFLREKIDINYRINILIEQLMKQEKIDNYQDVVQERLLDNFVSYTQELICSDLEITEKRKLFYEKFLLYKKNFAKPTRLSQKIVMYAGNNKIFYCLINIFKMKKK